MPPAVGHAFDRADRVVTEIPLDTQQQAELAAALLLPEGQRLRAIIGEARFARLEGRVRAALALHRTGGGAARGGHARPAEALGRDGATGHRSSTCRTCSPVAPLSTRSCTPTPSAAGKKVGGLETVAEQAGTFDAFSLEEQATLLDEALRDLEAPRGPTGAMMVEWYLEGNGEKLAAALSQGSGDAALARKFEAEVLVKRNHRMADRIEALRRDAPDETLFVAVGALHLVGTDNLPQLLQARGYEISRVRP